MIKFRLSKKDNDEYLDLFPRTSANAIVNDNNIRGKYVLEVDVPVTNDVIQTINIQTTAQIVDAPFEVHFVSGDKNDYNTISQVQVKENIIEITRLHNMPQGAIKIALVFYAMGVI